MKKIAILHGPNLDRLGKREPDVYGHDTLKDLEKLIRAESKARGFSPTFFQSNHEGELIDFIVELPSPVGNLRYYVKAKAKKKVNEGDLSTAFIKGQSKRLPVLFISKGEVSKKAQELLDVEFKGMKVSQIGR